MCGPLYVFVEINKLMEGSVEKKRTLGMDVFE